MRIVAPEVADAIPINLEPALLRLRHASTERELWELPNLLAVDFYESGGLFPVAEALNAAE